MFNKKNNKKMFENKTPIKVKKKNDACEQVI